MQGLTWRLKQIYKAMCFGTEYRTHILIKYLLNDNDEKKIKKQNDYLLSFRFYPWHNPNAPFVHMQVFVLN